jgi:hypothetical protein
MGHCDTDTRFVLVMASCRLRSTWGSIQKYHFRSEITEKPNSVKIKFELKTFDSFKMP